MKGDGLEYGQVAQWMARYGVLERTTKYHPADNVYSKGKRGGTRVKRKPGVSPAVFSKHLLGETVFVGLQDMTADLPPITEHVDGVKMDPELAEAYGALEGQLLGEVRAALARGDKSLLGSYVNALLSYPDRPFDNEPIVHPRTGDVIATPLELTRDTVYAKERKLIDLVQHNLHRGRHCFVYAVYTGTRDVTSRLQELLTDEGIHAEVLRASVDPEKREEWIRRKVEDGAEAVIANPKLVQTGLDLYAFPTLSHQQCGYSVYTLRQASRRAWRIGQQSDCRVEYLYYDSTLQQRAMQLMGSKLQASLAIEGRFSEDGLLALVSGTDMTSALAKALVDGLEGEGVEEMWAKLNTTSSDETLPGPYAGGLLLHVDPTGAAREKKRVRRKPRVAGAEQLGLFGE
jgi:hypothetical protein